MTLIYRCTSKYGILSFFKLNFVHHLQLLLSFGLFFSNLVWISTNAEKEIDKEAVLSIHSSILALFFNLSCFYFNKFRENRQSSNFWVFEYSFYSSQITQHAVAMIYRGIHVRILQSAINEIEFETKYKPWSTLKGTHCKTSVKFVGCPAEGP